MELDCSFQKLVGGNCGLSSRNPSKTTVVSLLSCKKDISGHKRCFGINDIDSEVELILACASIFSLPSDVGDRTVCPSYRYSLAIGWRRGSHHVLYRHVFQTTFKKGNREKQRPTAVLAKRFQELSFAELEYLLPQDLVYMTDASNCLWRCTSSIFSDKKTKFLEGFGGGTFLSGGLKQCVLGVLLRDILYGGGEGVG